MNKRTTKKIQPKQKLNSEQKADEMHVSPAIANALVQATPTVSPHNIKPSHLRLSSKI